MSAGAEPVLIVRFVQDPARSKRFWATVLDASPTLDVPGMVQFALGPGVALGLMADAGIARLLGADVAGAGPGAPARSELYLRVPDARAVWRRASDAGATILLPIAPRPWGEDAGYLRDPDGHLLAVAQQVRAAEPHTPAG